MACRFRRCLKMGNDLTIGMNLNSMIELISIMTDTWHVKITAGVTKWEINFDNN